MATSSFDEVFFRMFRIMKHEMKRGSKTANLTLQQIHGLFFIHHMHKVQMKEVAEYFHTEMSTATSLLNKLVALRLVKRHNDNSDRRVVYITLTPSGTDVVAEAIKQRKAKVAKMLSLLTYEEKASLLAIMEKVVTKLEKEYEK